MLVQYFCIYVFLHSFPPLLLLPCQDLCFLINGDPSAWLPSTLPLDVCLGLELLEIVLRSYPMVFAKVRGAYIRL